MSKQITKEELAKQNAILQLRVEEGEAQEKDMRHTLSVILKGDIEERDHFGMSKTKRDLSWMEIASEIGKLLAARTFYDIEGNVSEQEYKLEELRKAFIAMQNKDRGPHCECEC